MGRTGRNFAVDHWGVTADIIVTAKGMSSGYAPLGAVIASGRVVDAIANRSGSFTHGFTYNAHPVSVAYAAVRLAQQVFARLDQATVLLVGAGETIELAARHLVDAKAKRILVAEKQPMLQYTTPENIGALAVFLGGDAAETITGSAYSIDGGWTAQ